MAEASRRIPEAPSLDAHVKCLAQALIPSCLFPHPETVKAINGNVFPTIRARKGSPRLTLNPEGTGMFDDNTTPRWALLWAHGYAQTDHPKGWTVAHVWTDADEISAYTNLANLALVPEFLGSLTDKQSPLAPFLQWHTWDNYGWRSGKFPVPEKPEGYDALAWNYFEPCRDPWGAIHRRMKGLVNARVRILGPLMAL